MFQPAATDQNQPDDHQDHIDGPVVSSYVMTRKNPLNSTVKFDDPKVAPNQLQPSVGGNVLGSKFDSQKTLARERENRLYSISLGVASLHGGLVGVATALSPARARPFQVFSPLFFVGLGLTTVDAEQCVECSEAYYSADVLRRLEQLRDEFARKEIAPRSVGTVYQIP